MIAVALDIPTALTFRQSIITNSIFWDCKTTGHVHYITGTNAFADFARSRFFGLRTETSPIRCFGAGLNYPVAFEQFAFSLNFLACNNCNLLVYKELPACRCNQIRETIADTTSFVVLYRHREAVVSVPCEGLPCKLELEFVQTLFGPLLLDDEVR